MEKFSVTILGCGSATPSPKHYTSSQVVEMRGKLFMIDCGEGTQIQLRRSRVAFARINHIFISHLHGDHCFGLLGMISSFALLGRTSPLYIHAPQELWTILEPELAFYCKDIEFNVEFQGFAPSAVSVIYEDRSLTVSTIPLKHRVPCAGFLFREKPTADHLDRAAADFYGVPQWDYARIKNGGDFTTSDGTVIPHDRLTKPAGTVRSYAYCCDTAFNPSMFQQISGVSAIYHDCTYRQDDADRAEKHFHSTTADAARSALETGAGKLILGHFSARYTDENMLLEEACSIFPATVLAKENLTVDI
ncbi:MAG: ribonuclease Z [Bacteroidetes bacterium]|nr:ribonuclease Z [Candidatus Colenecus caballi]